MTDWHAADIAAADPCKYQSVHSALLSRRSREKRSTLRTTPTPSFFCNQQKLKDWPTTSTTTSASTPSLDSLDIAHSRGSNWTDNPTKCRSNNSSKGMQDASWKPRDSTRSSPHLPYFFTYADYGWIIQKITLSSAGKKQGAGWWKHHH